MSKARVTWAFQEVVASSKLNQANTDWIDKGQLIHSSAGGAYPDDNAAINVNVIGLGMWPYNPAKQVYDRMRVMTYVTYYYNAAPTCQFQYTLNAGGAWVGAPLATGLPFALPSVTFTGGAYIGSTINGYDDVDISGVAATTWFGWRINTGNLFAIGWWALAYLYNSVDTPH